MYKTSLSESFFPAQGGEPPSSVTIGDLLRSSAQQWPDAPALQEVGLDGVLGRSWTYAQLLEDAERLAGVLAGRHEKGARVAVWAPNLPEWILLEFGLAMAGVTLVTVNPSYQQRELEYVLTQSKSEALYLVDEFRGNPMRKIAEAACANAPAVKQLINMADHASLFEGRAAALPDVTPNDASQIQYTSGTTGFPKGAVLHHHGLTRNALDCMERLGFRHGDKSLNYMPLFHTTGCALHTLGVIGCGGEMLLAPMFEPVCAATVLEREKVSMIVGVPTMIIALIEEAKRTSRDFSSVRSVTSGGSMVSPELARATEQYFGSVVQIIYGQTETSPVITMAWREDSLEDLVGTIGQPLPHVDVSIRDPQTNEVTPCGVQGEICARGYLMMLGYNDNEEATAKTIDSDGWLHTGDLGTIDARGYVKITGRVKEMIIRGGENLFPAEIENAILEHDVVAEAAVAGVPDEKWGEQVACFMRAGGAEKPDASALKAFIRERISPQKTPAYWVWVDEWPLTGSGKIQKFKLVERFQEGAFEVLTV